MIDALVLSDELVTSAVALKKYRGVKYHTTAQNITGLIPPGAGGINHSAWTKLCLILVTCAHWAHNRYLDRWGRCAPYRQNREMRYLGPFWVFVRALGSDSWFCTRNFIPCIYHRMCYASHSRRLLYSSTYLRSTSPLGAIKILKHSTLAACHLFVWALCLYCTLCSLALGVWEKKADQVMCN
jgi:hypothetical protein